MKGIRYFCAVIALLLITTISAAAADNKEYELCSVLGILPAEEYNTDANVTRGELAYIAGKLSGMEMDNFTFTGEIFYKDVKADHEYATYINALTRLGLIKGFSDGLFEPDYNASYTDTAYTLVNILGYKNQAELKGGYPSGYIQQANELGLFKGTTSAQYITQKEMCRVIYNTLTSPRSIKSIEGDVVVYENDEENTILYDVFDTTEVRGIITANGITSLNVTGAYTKGVVINEKNYSAGADVQAMLGMNVTAFVQWDADEAGTVILAVPKDTEVVKLMDSDIDESSTVNSIIANIDGNNKTFKIDSEVEYIYNGKLAQNLKKSDIFIKNGYLNLIDNDDDGRYEIISITRYEACFAYSVSAVNEMITDKYGNTIDLREKEYIIYMDGKEITLADIQQLDCINYTRTMDDDNYVIYVTRGEMLSGMITGTVGDDELIIDGGSEYEISESYLKLVSEGKTEKLTIGMEATFYIDIMGRIMAYESIDNANRTEQYGFLIKVAGDYETGGVFAKMLTTDGTVKTIQVADRITIDGTAYKRDNSFINAISTDGYVRQVVRFIYNDDDMLAKLDTPYTDTSKGEIEGINLTEAFVEENTDGTWVNAGAGILDGRFYVDNSTIVFEIPSDDLKADMSLYGVKGKSVFSNGSVNTGVKGFDLTSDYTAKVAVRVTGGSTAIERSAPMIMISGFKEVYNEDSGDVVPAIITETGTVLDVKDASVTEGLDKGDVIRYATDAKNRIIATSVVADASQEELDTYTSGSENTTSYWRYKGELRYGVLFLIETSGNAFIAAELPSSDDPKDIYEFTRGGVTYKTKQRENNPSCNSVFVYKYSKDVYVYDKAEDTITKSDMTALNDALYKDNPNARIVIRQVYGSVSTLFVIK